MISGQSSKIFVRGRGFREKQFLEMMNEVFVIFDKNNLKLLESSEYCFLKRLTCEMNDSEPSKLNMFSYDVYYNLSKHGLSNFLIFLLKQMNFGIREKVFDSIGKPTSKTAGLLPDPFEDELFQSTFKK